ncbi:MAG: hypothetical protein JRF33_13795 [Deltaproteobacteria bacterium]|nr:hypothetical protein [Deltaproteobacteria bacterium]
MRSFLPAAALLLLLGGLFGRGSHPGGATLALMGLAVGFAVGLAFGGRLSLFFDKPVDACLVLLMCLASLPLAIFPAQSEVLGPHAFGYQSWSSILLAVLAGLPLGFLMGTSWRMEAVKGRGRLRWILVGAGLGCLVAWSAVMILSLLKGAFLVMVFAAPLAWPGLPRSGDRAMVARMMLTLMVVVSTMVLLFV